MRLASRLFRRPAACLAPTTPSELIERGLDAARDVVEAVTEAIEAGAPSAHRGRNTAVTVAAVTATALVATAAYVWWKRRDRVATIDAPPATVPVAGFPPAAVRSEAPVATAKPVAVEPQPVVPASVADADCTEARRGTPQPTMATSAPFSARPPATSGRFAMPGVRGVVLPGGEGALP
ncbi:MAG: hypothetical protein FJ035_06080 [Chloroflexi bacterium]|nr:hypothetical protein [Chloroflexota bacterium]